MNPPTKAVEALHYNLFKPVNYLGGHNIHEECIDWFDKTMMEKILQKMDQWSFFSEFESCY